MISSEASYIVKPAEKTPEGLMFLSDLDQAIALTHTPLVYFYRPKSNFHQNPVQILKDSLSKALVLFYPFAGRLQWVDGCRRRLLLNCNSMGVLFVVANSNSGIESFGDFFTSPEVRNLVPSVDYDKPIHQIPLLLTQVTCFSCGGVSLGLGTSHVAVDGHAVAHFISEWARIARGEQPRNPPFLDRRVLIPPHEYPPPSPGLYPPDFSPAPLLIGQSDSSEERKKQTTVAVLKLSKQQIEKLRNKANEVQTRHSAKRAFTRYEAVAGHMWKCACMVRCHRHEQPTGLRLTVDFRRRVEPPLPEWYLGNAVLPVVATAGSGELASRPLAYACGKIREAVEKITDEYVKSYLGFLSKSWDLSKFRFSHVVGSSHGAFLGNPNVHITSWISVPLYGMDFGWGKEIHVGPAGIGYDGRAYILRGHDEDGSFFIPIRLQVAHMDAFRNLFYEGAENAEWGERTKSNL